MALLLDTHVPLWIGLDDPRLSRTARAAVTDPDAELFVSSVVACEFEDLRVRDRLGVTDSLSDILHRLDASVLDYPSRAYQLVPVLPKLHKDPVDRMLIAHAIRAGPTLVTADAKIREYPVRTLW